MSGLKYAELKKIQSQLTYNVNQFDSVAIKRLRESCTYMDSLYATSCLDLMLLKKAFPEKSMQMFTLEADSIYRVTMFTGHIDATECNADTMLRLKLPTVEEIVTDSGKWIVGCSTYFSSEGKYGYVADGDLEEVVADKKLARVFTYLSDAVRECSKRSSNKFFIIKSSDA